MKSKIILSAFILCIFISGALGGFYAGLITGSGSMSSEIYGGGMIMGAAVKSLNDGETEKAKEFLCDSIKTRLTILEFVNPVLNDRKMSEVSNFKQTALNSNINTSNEWLSAVCT